MAPRDLTTADKGRIAEAAVLFRLSLLGYSPLRPMFEGAAYDWSVDVGSGRLVRLQVKCAFQGKHGAPLIQLTRSRKVGRKRYSEKDLDFFIGYSLLLDEAHVFSWGDVVEHRSAVAFQASSREAWHKITG